MATVSMTGLRLAGWTLSDLLFFAATTLALLLGRLSGRPFSFTGHAYDLFVASRPSLLRRKIAAGRSACPTGTPPRAGSRRTTSAIRTAIRWSSSATPPARATRCA